MKLVFNSLSLLLLLGSLSSCVEKKDEADDTSTSPPDTNQSTGGSTVNILTYQATGDLNTSFNGETSFCNYDPNQSNPNLFKITGNNNSVTIRIYNYTGPNTYTVAPPSTTDADIELNPGYFVPNISSNCSVEIQSDNQGSIVGSFTCSSLHGSGSERANASGTFSCSY